jgi:hypothetical protein
VLSPEKNQTIEKSLRFQISFDRNRIVPVSTGSKEFLECVRAPAALKSLEKYFLGLGKNLQPDDMKMQSKSIEKPLNLLALQLLHVIFVIQYVLPG